MNQYVFIVSESDEFVSPTLNNQYLPYFGILIILLFRVLYWGLIFSETPMSHSCFQVSCQRSDLDFEITDSGWAPPHEDPTDKDGWDRQFRILGFFGFKVYGEELQVTSIIGRIA